MGVAVLDAAEEVADAEAEGDEEGFPEAEGEDADAAEESDEGVDEGVDVMLGPALKDVEDGTVGGFFVTFFGVFGFLF